MKKKIQLRETQLRQIISECVNRVLQEEIDMGQIPSYQDRMDNISSRESIRKTKDNPELRKELRKLRMQIDDVDISSKDYKRLSNRIKEIKAQLGYNEEY